MKDTLKQLLLIVTSAAIGFGFGAVLLYHQIRSDSNRERASEIRKAVIHLQFIKDEFEANTEILRHKQNLVPHTRVLSMSEHERELLDESPLLRLVKSWVDKGIESNRERLEYYSSPEAKKYEPAELKRARETAEMELEAAQMFESILSSIEHLVISQVSPNRMELAFSQAAHRTDVLFQLPITYVMAFRRHYETMLGINRALNELADISKHAGGFNPIIRLFMPIPQEKHEYDYWINHLNRHLDNINIDDLRRFNRDTDAQITALLKELKRFE